MIKITLLLFILFPAGCFIHTSYIHAQQDTSSLQRHNSYSAVVTGVIYSVDPKDNGVNGIFLKEPDKEAQLYKLKGDCYRCEFYQGSIKGPFTITSSGIKPGKNSILTIYKGHNLMPGKVFEPGLYFPGAGFNLARIKTTVIENQNKTLKLRAN